MQNIIKIQAMDEMQYFFKDCNNTCMYCVLYTDGMIDTERLKRAVEMSFVSVPALRSRLVTTSYRPYWEAADFSADEIVFLKNSSDTADDINRAITVDIDAFHGPQMMIHVLRNAERDTMCFAINHVICDGAGMKDYLYLLGNLYSNLTGNINSQWKSEKPGYIKASDIYKSLSLSQKLKMPGHYPATDKDGKEIRFPFGGEPIAPFVRTFQLSRDRFKKLREFGKSLGCTVNDVIMAVDIRTLYRFLNLSEGANLPISCMIDLRKYIRLKNQQSVCNLTSTVTCDIGPEIGKSLEETALKVKQSMGKRKTDYSGTSGLFAFNCLSSILPFWALCRIMSTYSANPKISLTNIGVINKEQLQFSGVKITDVFITGAVKYRPYFQLAFSTYDGMMTFSVNLLGSEKDKKLIDEFYAELNDELPE